METREKGSLAWLGALAPLLLCLPCALSLLLAMGVGLLGLLTSALAGVVLIGLVVAVGAVGAVAVILRRRARHRAAWPHLALHAGCACTELADRTHEHIDANVAVDGR